MEKEDLRRKYPVVGAWYVWVWFSIPDPYDPPPDEEFGPMAKKSAKHMANRLARMDEVHSVMIESGRSILQDMVEQAELAAGWDPNP